MYGVCTYQTFYSMLLLKDGVPFLYRQGPGYFAIAHNINYLLEMHVLRIMRTRRTPTSTFPTGISNR